MIKLFLALVVFSSGAYAAHNGVIYTWGYASVINDILQAVKGAITGIDTLVKSAMAIAFFIFAIKKAMDNRVNPVMEFGKLAILFAGVSYFFLQAPDDDKHRFVIEDRITGEMHTVSQIPIGIGKSFSMFTILEDGIAELMETHFSTPSSISYRNAGLGYSLATHDNVSKMRIMDSYYARTYNEYISECVFYDISSGVTNVGMIVDNDNLAGTIFNTSSSRLTNKYTSGTPSGETIQCSEAATYLSNTLGTYIGDVEKVAAAMNGESLVNFQSHAGGIPELFFNSANNSRDYLQQMALINMTNDAIVNSAKASGLDPSALAWASAVADQQFTMQMQGQGAMAKKYLPKAKAYFTATIIGISWLIAILAIMFGDYKHITMFFTLMLWMVLWTPILLIINYFNDMNLRETFLAVHNASGVGFTINHNRMVMNKLLENSNFVNWMVMVTPLLAYAIAKASEHGFVSLASSLSQSMQGAARSGASEIDRQSKDLQPKIRSGNDVHGDIGGQVTSQTQSTSNGHSWNDSTYTDKGNGTQTYNGQMTDGSGSLGMVGGQVVNAQSQMALSAAHKNTTTASSELSEAISSSSSSVIGNDKTLTQAQSQGLSKQDTHNITEAKSTAISQAFEHMQGYGEDFNNLKRVAMQGGGNITASILDGKLGASGGVTYSGMDQDGKKYSWTDTSKDAEQNLNQIQEQFSKVVSGNSAYQASYAEMLKVTDSESYSQVQNAMSKLSNAEMTEVGLNANNLPAFVNNWIGQDERFSRMPKVEAAKVAMGELTNLSANGEWGKISDLVGQYGTGGFDMKTTPDIQAPTKFDTPDVKGQYSTSAGDIKTQTDAALTQSKNDAQGQVAEFKQENGGVQGQVQSSVADGKKWGEQGLFSRFWDENGKEMLVGAAGLGAALGLTSAGAKKIGGEVLDKFKGAKNVDELEEIMKKTDQLDEAIKKNSPEARKLMDELGLKDSFEKNGGVFNNDGSIDQTKTKLNQSLGDYAKSTARDDVKDFIKNNAYDSPDGGGNKWENAKKWMSETIDDAWKGVKNISPTDLAKGGLELAKEASVGVLLTPTDLGGKTYYDQGGKVIDTSMFSGTDYNDQGIPKNAVAWSSPDQPMVPIQGANNGQGGFSLVDKSDVLGKQVSDLQTQIKMLQKSSPSSSIPDSKGGKGEVL